MSREVKFRAWGIDRGKMHDVYNIAFHESYGYKAITNEQPLNVNTTFMNKEEFILMQYTGLKDKNGVEIYEGDLISCEIHNKEHVGLVEYSDNYGFYYLSGMGRSDTELWGCNKKNVIGNIYENPYLLEAD